MTEAIEIVVAVAGLALVVLSLRQGRSRGAAAALQMAALGLILMGASAIGVVGFLISNVVLSIQGWAGVGLLGLGGLLFFIGQALEGRGGGRAKSRSDGPSAVTASKNKPAVGQRSAGTASAGGKGKGKAADDDDFSDIEALLRKHGIE